MVKRIITITFVTLLLCIPAQSVYARSKLNPCVNRDYSIVVSTKAEMLYLCGSNRPVGAFVISIGKNGPGKFKQGDKKTPIGRYTVGEPRPSSKFHMFIPIGYPTDGQKKLGFTGGDLGIHGPWKPFRRLGDLNTIINWTTGCIAVGSNREIEAISKWVRMMRPEYIYIK